MSQFPDEIVQRSVVTRNQRALLEAQQNQGVVDMSRLSPDIAKLLQEKQFIIDGKLARDILVSEEGCVFFKDVPKSELKPGEEAVYPHQGESSHIQQGALPEGPFDNGVSCFAGGGHGEIKALHMGVVRTDGVIQSMELNPRARELAEVNAKLAGADNVRFFAGDILTDDLPPSPPEGRTLFFGNAPFALKVKGQKLDLMRDGGINGLEKTMAFAQKAFEAAKEGDVIVGVAYSRLDESAGRVELEEELKKLVGEGGTVEVELMKDEKLYRNPATSKKEQANPMSMDQLIVKATTGYSADGSPVYDEAAKQAYQEAAEAHIESGWPQLGYYRYVVKVNPAEKLIQETQERLEGTL